MDSPCLLDRSRGLGFQDEIEVDRVATETFQEVTTSALQCSEWRWGRAR